MWRHWELVPRDFGANLEWRRRMVLACREDPALKRTVRAMCAEDFCFWLGFGGWVAEYRDIGHVVKPFILWDFQVETATEVVGCIESSVEGRADVRVKKSRDMGASWILMAILTWYWQFRREANFLVVSRIQEYVDSPGDEKTLFAKCDFLLRHQPGFLVPRFTRTSLRLSNDETQSNIVGEATTGQVGRGGRFLAILLDEFAAVEPSDSYRAMGATRDATNCRIFNSTLGERRGAFHDVLKMPMREVSLPWWKHPKKAKGLYRKDPGGALEILDKEYRFPDGYRFRDDGRLSSPWRDEQIETCANRVEAAREIDMDEVESTYTFFETAMIQELVRETAKAPDLVGELVHDEKTGDPSHFVERPDGRLHLWFRPAHDGQPPSASDYAVGADVAAGTGASNTAISVGSILTGEKVAQLVDSHIQPNEAGVYAVALAKWFEGPSGGAELIWENPGPGRNFGIAVQRTGYARIWFQTDEKKWFGRSARVPKQPVRSLVPGWSPNDKDARRTVYFEYRQALKERKYVNRSAYALEECLQIVNGSDGIVIHAKANTDPDPTGARANHGDCPTADALCWKIMQKGQRQVAPRQVARIGSLAHRMQEAEEAERRDAEEP